MIDRAQQNWPEEVTINLVSHNGEVLPLGRNRAMRMLLEKFEDEQPKLPELSPYDHELNHSGTACAEDCPACRWVSEKGKQQ